MANVKISELSPLITVQDADVLPIVDNAVTKKVTAAILRSYTQGNSVLLTGAQTVAGIKTFTAQLASSVATGTAPFSVASTTKVTNLNADLLDGLSSADFQATLSGTGIVKSTAGTISYLTDNSTNWNTAFNDSITSAAVTGTTTKLLTLNQQDGGTITASWTDDNTDAVTSVFGRTGAVVAAEGDYSLTQLSDVTLTSPANGQVLKYNGTAWVNGTDLNSGTVTSVGMTVPTGLSVAGSPITTSGTLALSMASGYSLPTDASQSTWNTAYNDSIVSAGVTGTSTKTLTLNQQDGGTVTASWSDADTGLTSVGLSMPSAFSVANSPLTANGTLAVTGAGVASQYVRGDGTLAAFPTSTGGGSSVSYYFNGGTNQGTIGGNTYYEMSTTAVIGTGADFNINANGYIAQFVTDANDPSLLSIPAGNWNFEMWFSASSGGGSPSFYLELYKYDGATLTLISSGSAVPESITGGTSIDLYTTALAVPLTTLTLTDRLAVRVYVNHSSKTITLHTQNGHLCQAITTFSTGLTALNGLTSQVQNLTVGTSGTDFSISSATSTHTFNLPTASAANRGALSSADWTTFNNKQTAGNYITALTGEASASGPGSSSITLTNSAVIGKVLTGLNVTGGSVSATDSIVDAFGKVQNQINSLVGGTIYKGTWNASTNTPTLTSSVGTQGFYYIVSVAGSTNLDGITSWNVGDWAIFDGSAWQKVDNTDSVVSVNGLTGAVSLTTSNITEGTNLYYTEARVDANSNVAANTAARHNAVTLGTANGLSLSTQALSLGLASGSTNGALSSTDWTTFNNKQNALTNPITGTGTTNYLPKFTGASALGNSIVSDNGTRVTIDGDFRVALADANINLQGTSKSYLLQVVDSDNRLRIYDNTANAERFSIASTGAATFSSSVTAGQGKFYSGSSSIDGLIVGGAGGIGTTSQGVLRFGDAGNIYKIQGGQDYGAMNFLTNGATRFSIAATGEATFSSSVTATRGIFGGSTGETLTAQGTAGNWVANLSGSASTGNSYGLLVEAGTNSSDLALGIYSKSFAATLLTIKGNGAATFGSSVTVAGTIVAGGGDILGSSATSDYGSLTLRGGYAITTAQAAFMQITGYEGGGATQGALRFYTNNTERMRVKQNGNINFSSLPTSASGLSAGDIWNDSGTLKIV